MLLGKVLLVLAVVFCGAYMIDLLAGEMVMGQATVIDGDTLEISGKRIRLFGVDAFESSQQCEFAGKKWPCGRRAAFALSDYIKDSTISCRPTGKKSYERIVARCFKGTDGDLGRYQVQQGWALAATAFSTDYVKDQDLARAKLAGAWSSIFMPPWQYRQERKKGE